MQSLTTTQNDIQTALSPIPTANISDQATTAITQDSQSTVHSSNVQLISLPGSIDIPRTDLSPSVNQQPTSVNKGNNKISKHRAIFQGESQNSQINKQTKSVNNRGTGKPQWP